MVTSAELIYESRMKRRQEYYSTPEGMELYKNMREFLGPEYTALLEESRAKLQAFQKSSEETDRLYREYRDAAVKVTKFKEERLRGD